MIPTITVFAASPDKGRGLARDMRVRWALEEVGLPYNTRLLSFAEMKEPAHLSLSPFGQIPTYQDGSLALFETGSIILYIGQHHPGLLPEDPSARARAITWMFAAVSTVEPPILERVTAVLFEADKPWTPDRLPMLDASIRTRLDQLAAHMGQADWLDGAFSAGDLMMVHVLRRLGPSGLLSDYPSLTAYIARAEARPAYQRAFAAQLAVFTKRQIET